MAPTSTESPQSLLSRNVERFRGGLVFKADRLLYHPTLGSRVMKKKKKHHLAARRWARAMLSMHRTGSVASFTEDTIFLGPRWLICWANGSNVYRVLTITQSFRSRRSFISGPLGTLKITVRRHKFNKILPHLDVRRWARAMLSMRRTGSAAPHRSWSPTWCRKVNIRLPGKRISNTHGARLVYYSHLDDEVDAY